MSDESPFAEGDVVAGRFRLDHLLGRGGMGEVWAATHEVTEQRHALKVLQRQRDSEALRRRFLQEARAASRVKHDNVISIQDVFELDDGTPLMVMDLLEGETLRELLRRREALPLHEVAELLQPVLEATAAAHARGVVHRDLKPENIFVVKDEEGPSRIRVLDFGIAKLAEAGSEGSMTDTGQVLGTPLYMSPEQLGGEPDIDEATDRWALGVILYEMLTGGRPIEASHPGAMLRAILEEGHTPIASVLPELPDDVAALVEQALSESREERPTLEAMIATLRRHRTGAEPRAGEETQAEVEAPRESDRAPANPEQEEGRPSGLWLVAGLALAVGAFVALRGDDAPADETPPPVEATVALTSPSTPVASSVPTSSTLAVEPTAPAASSASSAKAPPPAVPAPRARPASPAASTSPTPPSDYIGGVVEEPPD